MLHSLAEITAAAGLDHPNDFRPEHFSRRVSEREVLTFAELYPALAEGALLGGVDDPHCASCGRWRARKFCDGGGCRPKLPACMAKPGRPM